MSVTIDTISVAWKNSNTQCHITRRDVTAPHVVLNDVVTGKRCCVLSVPDTQYMMPRVLANTDLSVETINPPLLS